MSKNFRLLTFDERTQSIKSERILVSDEHAIETKHSVYDIEDVKKYYNESDKNIYYVLNVDLPAKVEAENLKRLRRSMALHNIFKYDVKKPFDFMGLIPYLIILSMILFT